MLVLHHVPNVYNCGIRRCVHRVIVALLGYMRYFSACRIEVCASGTSGHDTLILDKL